MIHGDSEMKMASSVLSCFLGPVVRATQLQNQILCKRFLCSEMNEALLGRRQLIT